MASLIFVTWSSKGVSASISTSRILLYTSFTSYFNLFVLCVASSRSSMSLLYFLCSASLSTVTLTNSIVVNYACNWISCVTLVCKICSTFNGNCDNTKSIWLNACAHSCIYVVGNFMASIDIFIIWDFVDVDNGWDVVSRDSLVFVLIYVCLSFFVRTGTIFVDSEIWHNVAKCACTFMCISSYLCVARWNASSLNYFT